jgi:hypothetical protein
MCLLTLSYTPRLKAAFARLSCCFNLIINLHVSSTGPAVRLQPVSSKVPVAGANGFLAARVVWCSPRRPPRPYPRYLPLLPIIGQLLNSMTTLGRR